MNMTFKIIDLVFQIYLIMLFVRILGSWVPDLQRYRWMHFIHFYTDPYLDFFRKIIPPFGVLDISPMAAIFCLGFIEKFVKMFVSMIF